MDKGFSVGLDLLVWGQICLGWDEVRDKVPALIWSKSRRGGDKIRDKVRTLISVNGASI